MKMFNDYETLRISVRQDQILLVELDRPKKLNAMTSKMIEEIGSIFNLLNQSPEAAALLRVVVLASATDDAFSSGLDLQEFKTIYDFRKSKACPAEVGHALHKKIESWQEAFTAVQKCHLPVIAAINGACIGGAFDLICCTDIRICSADAFFSIKEIDVGFAADMGTLQRLPKIIGSMSTIFEWAYSGRLIKAKEAHSSGLVTKIVDGKGSEVKKVALEIANFISKKPRLALEVTKKVLHHAKEHSTNDGLAYVAALNSTYLQSNEIPERVAQILANTRPKL